ncbi:VOC family protein [Mycobacterium sp. URHB0021]
MPVFTVSDVDAARDAYVQVFGLREVMNLGWIATLADDDLRHQFSLMTKDATAPVNSMVSIEVDDVDSAYQAAVDTGLQIVHPLSNEDWGVRRFFFADAAANVVNVLTHQRDLQREQTNHPRLPYGSDSRSTHGVHLRVVRLFCPFGRGRRRYL